MRVREHLRDGLRARSDKNGTTRSWSSESEKLQDYTPPSRLFPGIILGTELASSLQVSIGDKVQVISPDGDETPFGTIRPRTRSFRVAGIFHSGMYQYDLRLAYMAYWEAARLLQVTGGPNHIEVVAHDAEQSRKISSQLQGMVQADTTEIRDWTVMNQALLSALAVERVAMFLVLGFIVLVASFNIVGSLVLIIMEKGREIAILRAMGGSSRWVGHTFLAVGVFIGVIGIGTGLGLGLLSCAVVALVGLPLPREYYVETVPVDVDPLLVITVVLVTAAVTLLATLYPTRAAARLVPSEGLRYE
jgi:lipoprotein-releasing system permease protein